MKVREDAVAFASGAQGIFGVVEKPDFSLIVPLYNGGFQLVRQYRYPVKNSFWEFPQGSYEGGGLKPQELAEAELREETGLTAGKIQEIGFLYEAYGYCNQGFHIFLATDLTQGEQKLEESERGLETAFFSIVEFVAMIERGEIRDAPTVSAYGLLQMKGLL